MPIAEDIINVNEPVLRAYQPDPIRLSCYPPGIVYSIYLSNGMIVTSPATFEHQTHDASTGSAHYYRRRPNYPHQD